MDKTICQIPIIVCGASGRMGRAVIETAAADRDHFRIRGGVCRREGETHLSDRGLPAYDSLRALLADDSAPAVIIDFSHGTLAEEHLRAARDHSCGILLGTTGYGDEVLATAAMVAQTIPVVVAPNTSLMANLLIAFSKIASARLSNCGVSILDIHHADKKDAPSGTAKALRTAIIGNDSTKDCAIASMRKGQVAGEHTVYFFNDFDRLELTHRVADRRIFAEGALVAAQFLFNRAPGLYDMGDVLNLDLSIKK